MRFGQALEQPGSTQRWLENDPLQAIVLNGHWFHRGEQKMWRIDTTILAFGKFAMNDCMARAGKTRVSKSPLEPPVRTGVSIGASRSSRESILAGRFYGSNEGGASSGAVPQFLLGDGPRSKSRVPPCSTKASGSQVFVDCCPLILRLWIYGE